MISLQAVSYIFRLPSIGTIQNQPERDTNKQYKKEPNIDKLNFVFITADEIAIRLSEYFDR